MQHNYEECSKIIKAIADANRLKIVDILSCGEMCACDILVYFEFTQPTLSHHMKILIECGIVNYRKNSIWSYYSLNIDNLNKLIEFFTNISTTTDKCICKSKIKSECK